MADVCSACQYADEMSSSPPPQVPADLDTGAPRPSESPAPEPREPAASDIVEIWGLDSFPASDPPANW